MDMLCSSSSSEAESDVKDSICRFADSTKYLKEDASVMNILSQRTSLLC